MLPILPRQFYWTDLKTMNQFYQLDYLNYDLETVFLRESSKSTYPFPQESVAMFNELYYKVTKVLYEAHYRRYWSSVDIKHTPYEIDDVLLLTMICHVIWLCDAQKCGVYYEFLDEAMNEIKRKARASCTQTWFNFTQYCEKLLREERKFSYSFKPRPISIIRLRASNCNWDEFTCNYDPTLINEIVNLWDKSDDQEEVREMIARYRENPDAHKSGFSFQKYYDMMAGAREALKRMYGNADVQFPLDPQLPPNQPQNNAPQPSVTSVLTFADDHLASPVAMKYWKRLEECGFVAPNCQLMPDVTRRQAMYIADCFSEKLGLQAKWKPFQILWNLKNLAQEKYKMQQTGELPSRYKDIDKVFSD